MFEEIKKEKPEIQNLCKWLEKKHPDPLYAMARHMTACALSHFLELSSQPSPLAQKLARLREKQARSSLWSFKMRMPPIEELRRIASGAPPTRPAKFIPAGR
jgi:hypothetical protein